MTVRTFKNFWTSKWTQFFLLLALVLLLAFGGLYSFTLKDRIQLFSFDTLNKINPRPSPDMVVIVDIDDESLREVGPWPWSRDIMADMILKLKSYGVKVAAFNMVFANPDRTSPHLLASELEVPIEALRNNDLFFSDTIKEVNNVVLSFSNKRIGQIAQRPLMPQTINVSQSDERDLKNSVFTLQNAIINLPEISQNARGNGVSHIMASHDAIARNAPLVIKVQDRLYPSLSLEALRVKINPRESIKINSVNGKDDVTSYLINIGSQNYRLMMGGDGLLRVKYRLFDKSKDYISAYKIMDDRYSTEIREKLFDKIVLVGGSAEGVKAMVNTPLGVIVPPVEVHANVIEQIVQNDFINRNDNHAKKIESLFILMVGMLIIMASLVLRGFFLALIAIMSIGGALVATTTAYTQYGLLFDPLYPSLSVIAILFITIALNYRRVRSHAREVKEAFGIFLAPDIVAELTKNPDKLKLGGEMRDLSIIYANIYNFSTVSQSIDAKELINTMSDYLTPLSDVVMQSRGTIDKYMGHAMVAFWNAPLNDDNHVRNALKASLDMRYVLDPINRQLMARAKKQGRPSVELRLSIGVNTGVCSVGNIGSKQRSTYSAIGEPVELASDLEKQAQSYGLGILIGEESAEQSRDFAIVEIDKLQMKGHARPVRIFTVLGDDHIGARNNFRKFRVEHKLFLRDYRRADFDKACVRLEDLMIDKYGQALKPYYDMMMSRMVVYQNQPPAADWDGTFIVIPQ